MDLDVLKIILLAAMTVLAIVCGVLPIKVYKSFHSLSSQENFRSRGQLFISLTTCFSGGVFLGVCLLDVLPDTLESWESVKKAMDNPPDYPVVPLLAGSGILLVWLIEEFTLNCYKFGPHGHSHGNSEQTKERRESDCSSADGNILRERKGTVISQMHEQHHETPVIRSITFISAFICHCSLEGFAFGVQSDAISITSLFVGIMIHKAVVFFSIGIRLVRAHHSRTFLIVLLITITALTAPLGGAIGMIVKDSKIQENAKNIVMTVLSSFSLGTFLYVTFFELLGPEKESQKANILQWCFTSAGFALIGVVMIFGG